MSWLSNAELKVMLGVLVVGVFTPPQVILPRAVLEPEVYILMAGIVRVTGLNAHGVRITIALHAPGPIPEFPPSPQLERFDFRCEAYTDCRIGSIHWSDFDGITPQGAERAFTKFRENDLQHSYRLLLRSSGLLKIDLHDRVAHTLLELCSDFGVEESRGTLLRQPFSHQDIADLVGATRPRVTEHLAQLERDGLVIRQGRYFIVRVEELSQSLTPPRPRTLATTLRTGAPEMSVS